MMQVKNFVCFRAHSDMDFFLWDIQTEEITRLNGIYKRLLSNAGVKLFEGEGKLVSPNEVEVTQLDGTKLCYSAKHILIATGSRAQRPNIPGQVGILFFLHVSCNTYVKQLVFWSTLQESHNQWTVFAEEVWSVGEKWSCYSLHLAQVCAFICIL